MDDEPQRLSRRPLTIALGAGLVAVIAFAASRWRPDPLQTAEAPVLDAPPPVATTSTPATVAALTEAALTEGAPLEATPRCVIVSDVPKLDLDVPCDVSPRAAPSPARLEQGRPRAAPAIEPPAPAPVADAPEDDLARARVGVLVDGRRVRLTLD